MRGILLTRENHIVFLQKKKVIYKHISQSYQEHSYTSHEHHKQSHNLISNISWWSKHNLISLFCIIAFVRMLLVSILYLLCCSDPRSAVCTSTNNAKQHSEVVQDAQMQLCYRLFTFEIFFSSYNTYNYTLLRRQSHKHAHFQQTIHTAEQ
jgi:hypothetical protein